MSQHIKKWQERIGQSAVKLGCWNIPDEVAEEIAELRAALASTPPQPAPQPGALHDAIKGMRPPSTLIAKSDAYNKGFADARHAAAELVAASQDERDADHHTIMSLSRLLAEVTVAVKGPEPEGGRHSYHDVPELVTKMAMELAIFRASVQQDRQDAERYRYLRNDSYKDDRNCDAWIATGSTGTFGECGHSQLDGEVADELIDAAIVALAARKEPKP